MNKVDYRQCWARDLQVPGGEWPEPIAVIGCTVQKAIQRKRSIVKNLKLSLQSVEHFVHSAVNTCYPPGPLLNVSEQFPDNREHGIIKYIARTPAITILLLSSWVYYLGE